MNTWDDYLNDLMSEIKLCAIVSYPDGVMLASKGIGQFRDSELKAFVHTYDKTCEERTGHAFTFDDVEYRVIYTGKHCIVGRTDNGGFFATKTQTAVIIAVFEGACNELGGVRNAVDNLAENLMGIGY